MSSIRRRLLFWQIGALLLTGLLVSVLTYLLAWDAFNRVRDYGLEQIAQTVVRHGVQHDADEEGREDEGQFVSQIWTADGSLFYSSLPAGGPPRQTPGFHVVEWDGARWRVFTRDERGLTIQVAASVASRASKFAEIVPWLLLPLGLLLVGVSLFIGAAVKRALAPLERVRSEIGRRGALHLHALDERGLPEEVEPLVRTLNDLLARLDEALVAQRRFLADAAHELRTPLAAVRLQAQLAGRAVDDAERAAALAHLEAGIDRTTHMVAQLLSMARLEPAARQMTFAPVQFDALVKAVVADASALAEARDIDLGIGSCEPVTIEGERESLRMLVGNLVDNALRYCPPGSRVDLDLRAGEDGAHLTVTDNGPGIPAAERGRVFERFHRLAGSEMPGTGLGLSIARRVVALHGGSIRLGDAAGGGLVVTVDLPARVDSTQSPADDRGS